MKINSKSKQNTGFLSACAGALLWGFSGVCAQFLFENYAIDSAFITMVRSVCAAMCFATVLVLKHRETVLKMLDDKPIWGRVAVFGVALFGSQFFYAASVNATNAGTATVLQMSYMIFVLAFTCVAFRRPPYLRDIAAFLCALLGTWVIATQGELMSLVLPAEGVALGLLNGLCVAAYVISPHELFDKFGSFTTIGVGISVEALFAVIVWMLGSATGTFNSAPALDATGIVVLVGGIGFLGTFVAFGLYLNGVAIVGSVKGGLLGSLEPIGAMVVSMLWLRTAFTGADWAGLALMLAMLALVTLPSKKHATS